MLIKGAILFIFLFTVGHCNSQIIYVDSICWNKNYKLTWSDFQGAPPIGSEKWKAACSISIFARGFREMRLPNFKITNCFIKKNAWTRDTVSTNLLEHERLHFDIAELHVRKMRKAIELFRKRKVKDFEEYSAVVQRYLKERNSMDALYDKETFHSMNLTEQKEWGKKIAKELDILKKYHY